MLEQEVSRRTLLKIIAAGCGLVVASSLPREWVKPVIDAGLLPVHAQTTSGGTLTGLLQTCGYLYAGESVTIDDLGLTSPITGDDCIYTITGVPAGTYDLTASNGATASGVVVINGGTTTVNLNTTAC